MDTHRLHGDIYQAIVEFIDAGRRFAVATVLSASGSTPRKAGTRALLDESGSLWGTIGGGLLEAQARQRGIEALASDRAMHFDFRFSGTDADERVPVCGGVMRVLIDPNAAKHRSSFAAAAKARQSRGRGRLVTLVLDTQPPAVNIAWQEAGSPADAQPPAGETSPGRVGLLVEEVTPSPLLVIVGGGHVAQALAEQARLVGFDLLVIEDRAEYARAELFPAGSAVRCGDAGEIISGMASDPQTYFAIVTRGHLTDARALAACLRKPAAYVGMMGSRRKVALLRRQFIESGRCSAEEFDRVRAPIGLELGAQTVPEIALSIAAELIAVRRAASREPARLSQRSP